MKVVDRKGEREPVLVPPLGELELMGDKVYSGVGER